MTLAYREWKAVKGNCGDEKALRDMRYQREKSRQRGLYCWRVSLAIVYAVIMLQLQGISLHTAYWYHWIWFGAFQALAAQIMQEKVNDAMQGKLLPSFPGTLKR